MQNPVRSSFRLAMVLEARSGREVKTGHVYGHLLQHIIIDVGGKVHSKATLRPRQLDEVLPLDVLAEE